MMMNLSKFIRQERPLWAELEQALNAMDGLSRKKMDPDQVKRFYYLYQRASSDLARLTTFSADRSIRAYLETLVARAYSEIYETRTKPLAHFKLKTWLFMTFPQTFQRHRTAFFIALAAMLAGIMFGWFAIRMDPQIKPYLIPFAHLHQDPEKRVREAEQSDHQDLEQHQIQFSSYLMTHNIRVAVLVLALGMTFGIGTLTILFYNGIILGAVTADYLAAGQWQFLLGWLLPHGSIEIPAILIAGQAGFVLGRALLGAGESRFDIKTRFQRLTPDLVTLISGTALLLVWAGVIEAFFSQYHEPVLPYGLKIALGIIQLTLLSIYLGGIGTFGRQTEKTIDQGKSVSEDVRTIA